MSDQQLVTGLAILVALYIKSCSVSVFSFEIALSVAYFSCSIHISTLTVLRQYLRDYKRLALIRIVLMVILAAMLLAGLIILESGTFYELPVIKLGCALADFDTYISHNLSWVQIGNTVMVCWFIISAYANFIFELYDNRFLAVPGNWYFWFACSVGMTKVDKDEQCRELSNWQKDKVIPKIEAQRTSSIRRILVFIPYILEEFSRSFLYKIIWMLFYFTFGASTFCVYWTQQGLYKHVLDVWGFGQLVPMFLLVLPLLSAYEIYEERLVQQSKLKKGDPSTAQDHSIAQHQISAQDNLAVQVQTTQTSAAQETKQVASALAAVKGSQPHEVLVSDKYPLQ